MQVKKIPAKGQDKKKNLMKGPQQEETKVVELQIQVYVFDGKIPSKHASREEWLRSYRERADKTFNDTSKLYNELVQFPYPNMALNTVRDHATDTLSLALTVGNKVSEVNVNLKKVPTTDIIHLNRETNDILNTRLLKSTLQISKLEASKTKNLDLLRKVRVKNKALKIQINNLQNESLQIDGPAYKGDLAQILLDEK